MINQAGKVDLDVTVAAVDRALQAYQQDQQTKTSRDDAIVNLITDLMHCAEHGGADPGLLLGIALYHYGQERP